MHIHIDSLYSHISYVYCTHFYFDFGVPFFNDRFFYSLRFFIHTYTIFRSFCEVNIHNSVFLFPMQK